MDYLRNRRERIEKAKWSAAGLSYVKGKCMKRELSKLADHVTSASSAVTTAVKQHVTQELSGLKAALLAGKQEATAQAKQRLRCQMQALLCLEEEDKKEAKQKREEEKKQRAQEKQQKQEERSNGSSVANYSLMVS